MAAPVKAQVRKIVSALKQSKQKYVPVARLSKLVGVYPDVLTDTLVYFEPMIRLDETINTRDRGLCIREIRFDRRAYR